MEDQKVRHLLEKLIANTVSAEELVEFQSYLQSSKYRDAFHSALSSILSEDRFMEVSTEDRETLFQAIVNRDPQRIKVSYRRVHLLKRHWLRYAAAVLLLGICLAAYLWFPPSQKLHNSADKIVTIVPGHDIAPGGHHAVLTLADGSTILLDSASSGNIAQQGNVLITKTSDGRIIYGVKGSPSEEVMMNTMSTPRGGQYNLTLPDGTKVWLNAASSITYPAIFRGKERPVTITGEIYFEVAVDKTKPFLVQTPKERIEVLGTSFNVNAYDDELETKTSLLEGVVRINTKILKPGEAYKGGRVVKTDMEQDLAWKNGLFNFNNLQLTSIMHQLARWYNIEIRYVGQIPEMELRGKMSRSLTLTEVLRGLSMLGLKFELEGNTLKVQS